MKRKLIGVTLVAVLIASAAAVVWADTRNRMGNGWCGRHWGGGPLGFAARELNLSEEQRSQIATMWRAERPQIATLVNQFANESVEMSEAEQNGADSERVNSIAAQQGATVATLLVKKEQLRSQIYAQVLNPEQRTKADEMEKHWQARLQGFANRLASNTK
jgi:Spy/CpxP family protein refolding chaperone